MGSSAPPPSPPPETPPPPEVIPPVVRPAWRTVPQRSIRRSRPRQDVPPPPQPLPAPRPLRDSWATWQPNPGLAPTPPPYEVIEPTQAPWMTGFRTPPSLPSLPPANEDIITTPSARPARSRRRGERRDTPSPPQPLPAPRPLLDSWATWQPNPGLAPTPPLIEPTPWMTGFTTPPSLPPSPPPEDIIMPSARPAWRTVSQHQQSTRRRGHMQDTRSPLQPLPAPQAVDSWVTWQPNPGLAPTPPAVEPTLFVLDRDRGSPGLFGPCSPRD